MSILTFPAFRQSLEQLLETPEKHTFLLAVSGGADSMVLANLFLKSEYQFQIAHINYKLRGEDSEADKTLVEDFCNAHKIKLHTYEVSEKDAKPEHSIQLWARDLRYTFFRKKMEEESLDFLVTAHHLNDELETFLINLSRGSGLRGLCGIPKRKNNILRPLLGFSKEEIYRFAKEQNIDFREDKSNKKNDYLRNKIRNEIVPKLLETETNFLENFRKSQNILQQNQEFTEQQISKIAKKLIQKKDDVFVISKSLLAQESDLVKFEILNSFGFNDDYEMQKIFSAETGRCFINDKFRLVINRDELIFCKNNSIEENNNEEISLEINDNHEIQIPENALQKSEQNIDLEWIIDLNKIKLPLKLRHKKDGDFFYPMGMNGKKKISKFFKDEKLSILAKSKVWILCDAKDDVLGIIPFRQDRRFAPNSDTKETLQLFINKK